jgi:hypothetical protein
VTTNPQPTQPEQEQGEGFIEIPMSRARELRDAEAIARIAEEALAAIKRDYGKVCDEYEICEHIACHSASCSWMVADEALSRISALKGQTNA